MDKIPRYQLWCYGVAAVSVAIALLLTLLLEPFMSAKIYALFYAAVAISAYYGGMRAGLLATLLSTLAITYFFIPPVYSFGRMDLANLIQLSVFVLVTLIVNSLNTALRDAKRRAERSLQKLEASEERYRVLAENVPQLVWLSRADGFVEYFNQRWYDCTGLTFDTSKGSEWQRAIHPEDLAEALRQWKTGLATGNAVEMQYRLRLADGSYRWHITRAVALRNSVGKIANWFGTCTDIHHQKQAEAALEQQKQELTALVENSPDIIARFDQHLRHLYVSPTIEQATGMLPEAFLGMTHREMGLSEPLCNFWDENLRQVFNTKRGKTIEFEFSTPNGKRYFHSMLVPEFAPDGSVSSVLSIARDLTEYKQAEQERIRLLEALKTEQKLLQATIEQMPAGLIVVEAPAGNLLLANAQAQQILAGFSFNIEEVEDYVQPTHAAFHSDGRPYTAAETPLARSLISGEIVIAEEMEVLLSNGWKTLLVDSRPICNAVGEIEAAIATFYDITERKRTEAALKQSEERFRVAQELSLDGFSVFKSIHNEAGAIIDFEWTYANPKAAEIIHHSVEEVIGQRLLEVLPETQENSELFDRFVEVVETGEPHDIEIYYKAKGVEGWFRNTIVQLGDGIAVSFSDITKRKQTEAERALLLERERTAREEAEKANRIKDEFLAVLSHELRSPLNPIMGWSKLLRTRKFDENKTANALETIERNAKLQAQLIEDLLDVSRILRGKLKLNIAPVNLATTIEAALETVRLSAEAKSIQIQTELNPNIGLVLGDSARLQQVIWNLVSNAVKFTPDGGRVEVKLERFQISDFRFQIERRVQTEDQNPGSNKSQISNLNSEISYAQITVTDNGKGINPDFLPYVFDYFRQADSSTTRKFGGLGLGLAIVRHLVELHGGTVRVESAGEGLGATFSVRLPLMKHATTTTETASDLAHVAIAYPLQGLRVLAVDDDEDMREYIACVLSEFGAEVTLAASADRALKLLSEIKPDLLVSDIGMPKVDGYMLMEQIRSLPPEAGGMVSAIALTAYAGEYDQKRAHEAGFQIHLAKPVEPEPLIAAIRRILAI